jgi:hypothetical protein
MTVNDYSEENFKNLVDTNRAMDDLPVVAIVIK